MTELMQQFGGKSGNPIQKMATPSKRPPWRNTSNSSNTWLGWYLDWPNKLIWEI